MPRLFATLVIGVVCCAGAGLRALDQISAVATKLVTLDVSGLRRYSSPDVVRLSGLALGQAVSAAELAAAADRLIATGLFKDVKYRYATKGPQWAVMFEIEEADWTMPVVFDNFVWFSSEELTTAMKREVPSFDGTAPNESGSGEFFAAALQRILVARAIKGRVHFTTRTDMKTRTAQKTGATQYVFSVQDTSPALVTCAVQVAGASADLAGELSEATKTPLGSPYSTVFISDFSNGTLLDVYRKHGYWRAAFQPPVGVLDPAPPCAGVRVTLGVSEGVAYAWDRAEWLGSAALPAQELDKLLGLKSGVVADASRIESGLRVIQTAYRKGGYLEQRAAFVPELNDTTRRAVFRITMSEGRQFRMGKLTIEGFTPQEAAGLSKAWRLQPGDVYDGTYLSTFMGERVRPLRGQGPGARNIVSQEQADPGAPIVNVTIAVK